MQPAAAIKVAMQDKASVTDYNIHKLTSSKMNRYSVGVIEVITRFNKITLSSVN